MATTLLIEHAVRPPLLNRIMRLVVAPHPSRINAAIKSVSSRIIKRARARGWLDPHFDVERLHGNVKVTR